MTELEKSKKHLHAEVDMNKLLEELRESMDSWMEDMRRKIAGADFAAFYKEVDLQTALQPASLALYAFNTVLARIGMTDARLPFLLGAMGALENSLTEQLGVGEKMRARTVKEVLTENMTTVTMKVPRKGGRA